MFTFIQLACLICLWLIKSFHSTSILFPLMVSTCVLLNDIGIPLIQPRFILLNIICSIARGDDWD